MESIGVPFYITVSFNMAILNTDFTTFFQISSDLFALLIN